VVELGGQKGVGKSVAVSSSVVSAYIDEKIKYVNYLRYNKESGNFDSLFFKGDPDAGKRVVIIDDIHYFLPDFHQNVLVEGNVGNLDRFVQNLIDMTSFYLEEPTNTTMVYVSDTLSYEALRKIYDKMLFAAGRGDLIKLLPDVTSKGVGGSPHLSLDSEFYGKTYTLLKGKPEIYKTASMFAEIMEEDTGMLARNPRILKQIIDTVDKHGLEIDDRFNKNWNLAKLIYRGEITGQYGLDIYYFKERERLFDTYFSGNMVENVISMKRELNNLSKEVTDIAYRFKEAADYSKLSENFNEKIELDIKNLKRSAYQSVIEIGNSASKKLLKKEYAILNKMKREISRTNNILLESDRSIKKLAMEIKNLSDNFQETLSESKAEQEHYLELVPLMLNEHNKYKILLDASKNYIGDKIGTVTLSDVSNIKAMIEDPDKILENINKNTISLISNLTPVPYYSTKWR
jgi:hypothetical protein